MHFRVALLCWILLLACGREPNRTAPQPRASSKASAPAVEPSPVLTLGVSAYAASLFVDDEAIYLLTSSAAYRRVPGKAPEHWALELGSTPALGGEHLVYWFDGAIRRAPKRGGETALLAKVSHTPQRLSASGEHFAWLDQAGDGRFTLQTLDGSQPRVVYAPIGYVAAITLLDDQLFFIEQHSPKIWRLGVVPLSADPPRYTSMKSGRTPSMLAASGADIFYYDGLSSTVRKVSPDLQREEVVANDIICSPLAVSEKIYCAQPAGILELPRDGGRPRPLPRGRPGLITALAASRSSVAWLVDIGQDQLLLQVLPISASAPAQ